MCRQSAAPTGVMDSRLPRFSINSSSSAASARISARVSSLVLFSARTSTSCQRGSSGLAYGS